MLHYVAFLTMVHPGNGYSNTTNIDTAKRLVKKILKHCNKESISITKPEFGSSSFLISHLENKKRMTDLYIGEGPGMQGFWIFSLPQHIGLGVLKSERHAYQDLLLMLPL
jgi:hypothetical protein